MSQQKNNILINEHALNRELVPLKMVYKVVSGWPSVQSLPKNKT